MNFKKLLPTGFAVTACFLGWSTSSSAQVLPAEYEVTGTNPELALTIDLVDPATPTTNNFKITLSAIGTGTNTNGGDLFGFAFNFRDATDAIVNLEAGDFTLKKANDPTQNPMDVTNDITSFMCYSAVTGTNTCDSSLNFNGDGGGNTIPYDYIYQIAGNGSNANGANAGYFINMVEFEIDATDFGTDLGNPFSNLSARVQSTVTDADGNPLTSFKEDFVACDGPCENNNQNPPGVPEIDGPVLIQVGFALGGLYLLLLGRRRQEDELAQAA